MFRAINADPSNDAGKVSWRMVNYRRMRAPGATYFFTVTLRDRRSDLLVVHGDTLREVFRHVRNERPFVVEAIVVLPDHLHAVWRLPPEDADYSGRWRAIKARFTRELVCGGVPLVRDRARTESSGIDRVPECASLHPGYEPEQK